jgi:hypothetical protein
MYRVNYYNETPGIQFKNPSPNTASPTMQPTTLNQAYDIANAPRISDSGLEVIRYGVVTDNNNGNYTVRICPVIAGLYEVHVLLNGAGVSNQPTRVMDSYYSKNLPSGRGSYFGQYIADSPYRLFVSHTRASVITSTVRGLGLITATEAVPSYITLTVRDPYDNVLRTRNYLPSINIRLDKSPNAYTSVWDFQNGSYLLEYVPQLAGLNYISINVNGYQIKDSPFNVTVLPGVTKTNVSFASGPGLKSGVTGQTSYFVVKAFDAHGNRKTDYNDQFSFVVSGANSLSGDLKPCPLPRSRDHPICDPLDAMDGYYYGSFVPIYTGTIIIDVYLRNGTFIKDVSNSPFQAIIIPSGPKAEYSDISGNCIVINIFVYLS